MLTLCSPQGARCGATITAEPGYCIAVQTGGLLVAIPCLPKFCSGGSTCSAAALVSQATKDNVTFSTCCAEGRTASSLCGRCETGKTDSGGTCIGKAPFRDVVYASVH